MTDTFAQQIAKFTNNSIKKIEKVRKASALDLFTSIVLSTPVDKGVLINNWFATFDVPSVEKTDSEERSGRDAISAAEKVLTGDKQNPIYITNNLPYAARIEFDGHSSQKAPQGMVRINTIRWPDIVLNNARIIGRE